MELPGHREENEIGPEYRSWAADLQEVETMSVEQPAAKPAAIVSIEPAVPATNAAPAVLEKEIGGRAFDPPRRLVG